jgi:hypothetical protein
MLNLRGFQHAQTLPEQINYVCWGLSDISFHGFLYFISKVFTA